MRPTHHKGMLESGHSARPEIVVSIVPSRMVAFPISGVDMPKTNKHLFTHYQCLTCGSSFHRNELHACGEPHLDKFEHSTFIGPMCNNCMKAHYITNHEDQLWCLLRGQGLLPFLSRG